MSTLEVSLWAAAMLVGFIGSALYSGIETGFYSLNRVRLHVLAQQGRPAAKKLDHLVHKPTLVITTLLIGNNVANYMGTSGLTVLLEAGDLNEWQLILLNTVIITPILFVFGETLPKDLFAGHADRWLYRLVRVITWSRVIFTITGLVPVVNLGTRLLMRLLGETHEITRLHPRRQVHAMVREGVGYGVLSDEQSAIVQRVLSLGQRTVVDEMVPWDAVTTVDLDDGTDRLFQLGEQTSTTRFPVIETVEQGGRHTQRVVGVVDVMDALVMGREAQPTAKGLKQALLWLDPATPLRPALQQLQREQNPIAGVGTPERPLGIVTIKDLVEPITGELVSW